MNRTIFICLLLLVLGAWTSQSQEDFAGASVTDVQQFLKFELVGGRITDDGWDNGNNRFFLNTRGTVPEAAPKDRNILVVSDNFKVILRSFTPTGKATVEASFSMCYGTVNPQLQFGFVDAGLPHGVPMRIVCVSTFDMDASRIVRAHIGANPDTIMLDRKAAIAYVAQKHADAKDPVIRKNADASLTALRSLKD